MGYDDVGPLKRSMKLGDREGGHFDIGLLSHGKYLLSTVLRIICAYMVKFRAMG